MDTKSSSQTDTSTRVSLPVRDERKTDNTTAARRALPDLARGLVYGTLGGIVVVGLFWFNTSAGGRQLETFLLLVLAAAGIYLAVSDYRTQTLPNRVIFPLYTFTAITLTGIAASTGDWASLLWAAIGGVTLWTFYFLLGLTGAMAYGDVKLAGVIGLYLSWYSWTSPIQATILAFALALPHAITLMIKQRRTSQKIRIPFGPYMIAGMIIIGAIARF